MDANLVETRGEPLSTLFLRYTAALGGYPSAVLVKKKWHFQAQMVHTFSAKSDISKTPCFSVFHGVLYLADTSGRRPLK